MLSPPITTENKISDLQVLRGVSILFVLFYHLSITPNFLNQFPNKVTVSLHVGVQIFFLLSGYVVTRSLAKDGYHGPRFFLRRVFRLLPAIFVFLGFTAVLNYVFRTGNFPQHARELFSIEWRSFVRQGSAIVGGFHNLLGEWSFSNGAMWSLSVEDQFYACVTVIVSLLSLVCRRRPKVLGYVMLSAAAGLYLIVTVMRVSVFLNPERAQSFPRVIVYMSVVCIDYILLGVVLAFASNRLKPWIERRFKESGPFATASLLAAVLGLLAICESPLSSTTRYLHGIGFPLAAVMIGGVVLLAANNLAFPASRGVVYRTMEHLGDRSYTFYLFHFPVFAVAWIIFHFAIPSAFAAYGTAQVICCTLLLVPLCEAIYRYVELPCMRRGRALAERLFPRPKLVIENDESQSQPEVSNETPRRRAA